jgi:hypothetical protein
MRKPKRPVNPRVGVIEVFKNLVRGKDQWTQTPVLQVVDLDSEISAALRESERAATDDACRKTNYPQADVILARHRSLGKESIKISSKH